MLLKRRTNSEQQNIHVNKPFDFLKTLNSSGLNKFCERSCLNLCKHHTTGKTHMQIVKENRKNTVLITRVCVCVVVGGGVCDIFPPVLIYPNTFIPG